MKIAVAGGTGTVGTHVVSVARAQGHEVVVLSRSAGVDLVTGAGLDAALTGVSAVVDVASLQTQSAEASTRFFSAVTTNLLAAEGRAGVSHHVALSIVGIDGSRYGYYQGKLAQERLLRESGAPFTVLRATQFHEFAQQMVAQLSFGPFTAVPSMRTQPVAAREVATRLVALAAGAPEGRVTDLAGPREENLARMVRAYLRATGRHGLVMPLRLPGAAFVSMRDGSLLPGADADLGTQTYDEWVATAQR